jgi:hypothetical protein
MTQILNASITAPGAFYGQPFMSNDRSQRFWPQHNNIELVFAYGSGGVSVDAYLQVSHDGANWKDIGHFGQLATSTTRDIWRTSAADSVLDADQQAAGSSLNWWRTRHVVVGNYVGTSLQLNVIGADLVHASPF